jgi:hypothetical protein
MRDRYETGLLEVGRVVVVVDDESSLISKDRVVVRPVANKRPGAGGTCQAHASRAKCVMGKASDSI